MFEFFDDRLGRIKVVNVTEARASMASIMNDKDFTYIITKNNRPVRVVINYGVILKDQILNTALNKIVETSNPVLGKLTTQEQDFKHQLQKQLGSVSGGSQTDTSPAEADFQNSNHQNPIPSIADLNTLNQFLQDSNAGSKEEFPQKLDRLQPSHRNVSKKPPFLDNQHDSNLRSHPLSGPDLESEPSQNLRTQTPTTQDTAAQAPTDQDFANQDFTNQDRRQQNLGDSTQAESRMSGMLSDIDFESMLSQTHHSPDHPAGSEIDFEISLDALPPPSEVSDNEESEFPEILSDRISQELNHRHSEQTGSPRQEGTQEIAVDLPSHKNIWGESKLDLQGDYFTEVSPESDDDKVRAIEEKNINVATELTAEIASLLAGSENTNRRNLSTELNASKPQAEEWSRSSSFSSTPILESADELVESVAQTSKNHSKNQWTDPSTIQTRVSGDSSDRSRVGSESEKAEIEEPDLPEPIQSQIEVRDSLEISPQASENYSTYQQDNEEINIQEEPKNDAVTAHDKIQDMPEEERSDSLSRLLSRLAADAQKVSTQPEREAEKNPIAKDKIQNPVREEPSTLAGFSSLAPPPNSDYFIRFKKLYEAPKKELQKEFQPQVYTAPKIQAGAKVEQVAPKNPPMAAPAPAPSSAPAQARYQGLIQSPTPQQTTENTKPRRASNDPPSIQDLLMDLEDEKLSEEEASSAGASSKSK